MSKSTETIIYQGRPSWLNYLWLYGLGLIILVFLIAISKQEQKENFLIVGFLCLLITIILSAIFRWRYLFTITDNWVVMREGLIARNTNEMRLNHIRAINVRQGVIERILGIGTVIFLSAAEGEAAVIFKGIRDPHGVKERIRG